ncbi:GTP-binding protein 10 [Tachypleus tridentatus]|uniref:GTP-binding protein 10 n=1 Tax=Tachypleus tridentatus TaxID=6853 RepID=UPI003FD022D5
MVRLSLLLRTLDVAKSKRSKIRKSKFIDSLRIHVKAGAGGMGLPKFGGMGGKGGDVYIEAKENIELKYIKDKWPDKRFKAGIGQNSRAYRILGEPGEDLIIPAPVGLTVVSEHGRVLADLNKDGDRVLVAAGGAGGGPQNQFSGQKGQAQSLTLDLKLIADVGLVGFPNAGKSTLLKTVSRASPKIASYPFTTITPNLGVMMYDDFRQISVADLPGLIEGAHRNYGMGHKFLKHLLRTRLLMFVVDIGGFRLKPHSPFRSALETIFLLNQELELYKEDLLLKPAILAITKMDTKDAENKFQKLKDEINYYKEHPEELPCELKSRHFVEFHDVIPICAMKAVNVVHLRRIREVIDFHVEIETSQKASQCTDIAIPKSVKEGIQFF